MYANKARTHVLIRTNARGIRAICRCPLCGAEDLTIENMYDECENPDNVSEGAAIIVAIIGAHTH